MVASGELEELSGTYYPTARLLDPEWTCNGNQCTTTRDYFRTCVRPAVLTCTCGATEGTCGGDCEIDGKVRTGSTQCKEGVGVSKRWNCVNSHANTQEDKDSGTDGRKQCRHYTNSSGGTCSCPCEPSGHCGASCTQSGIEKTPSLSCPAGQSGTRYKDIRTCSGEGKGTSTCQSPLIGSCTGTNQLDPEEDCECVENPSLRECEPRCEVRGATRVHELSCSGGGKKTYQGWTCYGRSGLYSDLRHSFCSNIRSARCSSDPVEYQEDVCVSGSCCNNSRFYGCTNGGSSSNVRVGDLGEEFCKNYQVTQKKWVRWNCPQQNNCYREKDEEVIRGNKTIYCDW